MAQDLYFKSFILSICNVTDNAQMLWSPMSEVPQVGRNPVYIGTLLVFVLFQIPTALATNFGMLLAFRFLTGFFGSPVLATGGASIGDMFRGTRRAYPMAVWGIGAVSGPVLGPLVGGFAVQARGWTWTIWELMWSVLAARPGELFRLTSYQALRLLINSAVPSPPRD
jgi:multidrug resistance protein